MKGIIIAAGYGTRFLPCTKTIPKEMFPLIDTPAIDFIVDEFIDSGINDILIVSSRRKKALEDYFDIERELKSEFSNKNDIKKLNLIKPKKANFYFIRQMEMLGTGHAILICKGFIGKEPFIVAYPDDIIFSETPLSKQLIDVHNRTKSSILALETTHADVSRYGVVDYKKEGDLIKIKSIVEKPAPGRQPSNMISTGRYLFTPEIFDYLEEDFTSHAGGEFYHINAINRLADNGMLYGCEFSGERFDIGDKTGYFEGIIKYGLLRDDLKNEVREIIKKYSSKILI